MRKLSGHPNTFNTFFYRTGYFRKYRKYRIFPRVINNWNKLDPGNRDSSNYSLFRKSLLKIIRPVERKTFHINGSIGIKLLTRARLSFSHLRQDTFRHNFKDTLNPLRLCSLETETITHFFGRCHFYNEDRAILSFCTKWDESVRLTIIW